MLTQWDDFSENPTDLDWSEFSPSRTIDPASVNLQDPSTYYARQRLAHPYEQPMTPFGPANPSEVLSLPQVINAPAAAIEQSGIPQAASDLMSDLLHRTGIDPSATPGQPILPEGAVRSIGDYIPLPGFLEGIRQSGKEQALGLSEPGNLALIPFSGLRAVQTGFGLQALASIPPSIEEAFNAPNAQGVGAGLTKAAGAGAIAYLIGKHGKRGVEPSTEGSLFTPFDQMRPEDLQKLQDEIAALEVDPDVTGSRVVGLDAQGNPIREPQIRDNFKVQKLQTLKERLSDASQNAQAAEIHGDVRPQPGEGEGQVPPVIRGEGVQPQAAAVAQENQIPLIEADQTLSPEEQAYLDAERGGLGETRIEAGTAGETDEPFAGNEIATIDRKGNRILINPPLFKQWLASIPERARSAAVKSLIGEENIHLRVTDAMARAYWKTISGVEQAINRRRYVGTWKGDRLADGTPVNLSDTMMGHEALRFRMQQIARMTPREIAEAVGTEKWTIQAITAMESVVRTIRQTLHPKTGRFQSLLLDRIQNNLDTARAVLTASKPAALNKYREEDVDGRIEKLSTASLSDFDKDVRSTEEGLTGEAYRVGVSVRTPEQLEALKREQAAALERSAEFRKSKDLGKAFGEVFRAQFWREAYEAATGTGSAGFALNGKEGYQPPFPQKEPAALRKSGEAGPELIVRPGFVRLYHGEGGPEGAGAGGAWWTKNLEYARSFGENVNYVDVPEEVAAQGLFKARRTGVGGPHFILPDEYSKQAKPMENPPGATVHDLGPAALRKNKITDQELRDADPSKGVEISPLTPGQKEWLKDNAGSFLPDYTDDQGVTFRTQVRPTGIWITASKPGRNGAETVGTAYTHHHFGDILNGNFGGKSFSPEVKELALAAAREIEDIYTRDEIPESPEQSFPAALRKRRSGEPQGQPELILPPLKPGEQREAPPSAAATPPGELPLERGTPEGRPQAGEFMKVLTPKQLEQDFREHFEKNARPSFKGFVEEVGAKYGGVKPGQLRDFWMQGGVWDQLMRASGDELTRMRNSLGLSSKLGKGRVPDPIEPTEITGGRPQPGQTELPGTVQRKFEPMSEAQKGARNYRANVIASIGEKLLSEAQDGNKVWRRTEVKPEDLGGTAPFQDITGQERKDVKALGRTITEGAASSRSVDRTIYREGKPIVIKAKRNPETVTKRLTALADQQTGKVHLVSSFRDVRGNAMVLDPRRSARLRPNVPLAQLMAEGRFRPMATALLDEPVQNFHQTFDSVRDFENGFAHEARAETNRQAAYEATLGPVEEPGIDPTKVADRTSPWEERFRGPVTEDQAAAVIDHLVAEVGKLDTREDVKDAITALHDAREREQLTDLDWDAIAGYAKAFEAIGKKWEQLTDAQIFEQMVDEIYDKASKADSSEAFAKDFLGSYREEPIQALSRTAERGNQTRSPEAKGISREVTTMRTKAPTFDPNVKLPKGPGPTPSPAAPEPAEKLSPEALQRIQEEANRRYPYTPTQLPTPWEAPDELPGGTSPAAIRKRSIRSQSVTSRVIDALTASVGRRSVRKDLPRLLSGIRNEANLYTQEAANAIRLASGETGKSLPKRVVEFLKDPVQGIGDGIAYFRDKLPMTEAEKRRSAVHVFIAAGKENKFGAWFADKKMIPTFRANLRMGEFRARNKLSTGSLWERRTAKAWLEYLPELEASLDYAEAHWRDKDMWSTVKSFRQEMKAEIDHENLNGANVTERSNYWPARYEGEFWHDNGINFSGKQSLLGTAFRKKKSFQNLFEAAADPNGPYIAASLDAADIASHRISQGRRQIASRLWVDSLKGLRDPDSKEPIGRDPVGIVVRKDITDPTTGMVFSIPTIVDYKPPTPDYSLYYPSNKPGTKPIAIRNSFRRLVDTLLKPSQIEEFPGGPAALAIAGALKHGAILVLDTFHPTRVYQYGASNLGLMEKMGYKGGVSALNYRLADMDRAVAQGLISKESADWAKEKIKVYTSKGVSFDISRKELGDEMVKNGLNATKITDALYKDSVAHIPIVGHQLYKVLGPFNRWLFDKFMPGLMLENAVREFERYNAKHPEIPINNLIKDINRDMNIRYGNLGNQGMFKSKTFQDAMQILFLAPMWQEGIIRSELAFLSRASGVSYLAGRRNLPYLGSLGRGVMNGLGAYFAITQVINLITRGQPTWKNPEPEHKWDAWIPFGHNGVWMSPMAVFAEMAHDIIRLNAEKETMGDAARQIVANRLGPIGKAMLILATGKSPLGEKYTSTAGLMKGAAGQFLPTPISFSTGTRALLHGAAPNLISPPQPGAVARQLMASMTGIKVQAAKSPLQEQSFLAKKWLDHSGLRPDPLDTGPTDQASYSKLRNALRNEDQPTAASVLEELRKYHPDREIITAMRRWKTLPLTGNKRFEHLYVISLSPAQREEYRQAMQQKQKEYNDFTRWMLQQPRH